MSSSKEDWYTMQEAHGCKAEVIPRLTGSTRWLRRPRKCEQGMRRTFDSQGMYDMIEAFSSHEEDLDAVSRHTASSS
jgi:hypothetical protein